MAQSINGGAASLTNQPLTDSCLPMLRFVWAMMSQSWAGSSFSLNPSWHSLRQESRCDGRFLFHRVMLFGTSTNESYSLSTSLNFCVSHSICWQNFYPLFPEISGCCFISIVLGLTIRANPFTNTKIQQIVFYFALVAKFCTGEEPINLNKFSTLSF